MTVLEIQRALLARGYDPGPLDGLMGAKTRAAVRAFQGAGGLLADGKVGPKTLAALAPELRDLGARLLTADVIRAVCPKALPEIVEGIANNPTALQAAGILTKMRAAQYLAQIATETVGLTQLEENLTYTTPERLMAVWPTRFKTVAAAKPFVRNPEALANKVYGGRLGNVEPGDGWKYRGGSLIMTTGRANYAAAGYEDNPEELRAMPDALNASLVFWMGNGLNALADTGNVAAVRRRVQGASEGLDSARTYFNRARKALAF